MAFPLSSQQASSAADECTATVLAGCSPAAISHAVRKNESVVNRHVHEFIQKNDSLDPRSHNHILLYLTGE